MHENPVNRCSEVALRSLAWILGDPARAHRFLDLTGLSPETLRATAAESATHRAVLDFLCAHEPDLVGAAEALGLDPAELAAAREGLAS